MASKKIRLAIHCTSEQVALSESDKACYLNMSTKSIFMNLIKRYRDVPWSEVINVPTAEFAIAIWKTYLLRTPSNKGNVKRDEQGNKIFDPNNENKKCIRNTSETYFNGLSDQEKESRCMHIIKHLRKYFKITAGKHEWVTHHPLFQTAAELTEELWDRILPNRLETRPNEESSPPTTPIKRVCTRKRKRADMDCKAKKENQNKRRRKSDSDVSSSSSSPSENSSPIGSPSAESMVAPVTPDLLPEVTSVNEGGDLLVISCNQFDEPMSLAQYDSMAVYHQYYEEYCYQQAWERTRLGPISFFESNVQPWYST